MRKNIKVSIILIITISFAFASCSVYQSLVNVTRLKFKLAGVDNVYVANVPVMNKTKLSDFSFLEIAQISASVLQKRLPVACVLNINAVNPNDGKGGYARTNASLQSFPYRLVVDSKEILTGNISSPVPIPGTGEQITIPLAIQFDLMQNFQDRGYESLVNVVLSIAGKGNGNSNVELYAKPVIGTELGNISYPGELKIVEKQFTN